jgi:acetyl esterase/lipase
MRWTARALVLAIVSVGFCFPRYALAQQENRPQQERGFTWEWFLQRHDDDGDGVVARAEFKGEPRFFGQLDADGDGRIAQAEFAERTANWRGRPQGGARRLPEGTRALRDLEYAQVDGQSLKLDLYLPAPSDGKPPLFVWIHGGGWRNGSKAQVNPVVRRLTGDGYATASIDYRLEGLESHPTQIHDCKGAVRWLRAHADEYGYDPERIAVGGGSAGGHLALLLGLSAGVKALEGEVGGNLDQPSAVLAIVDLFGPASFDRQSSRRPAMADLFRSAAPVTYLDAGDPPVIIFHGDKDPTVPVAQSKLLDERCRKLGLESSLHIIEGAGHGGLQFSDEERYALTKAFLDRHLKRVAEPDPPATG